MAYGPETVAYGPETMAYGPGSTVAGGLRASLSPVS